MQAISIYIFLGKIYIYIFLHFGPCRFSQCSLAFSTLSPYIREVVSSTLTRRSTGKLIEGATVGV